ncbi:hypothetical protein [Fluviicola chungangensis]|uniref:Uncharacterized protein n=1 Tax=Fluviicola chungangensis TaxID=2597671 RepID=A0A556MJB3_9FLAO|nr:hypothetical protein [Fluviicola chungangensis]TSJ40004.1 hypothetical protein FO442_17000 [Fluviicola chungangensis]
MKSLFTLLLILMLTACTITKRHFGAGYHVEWKRAYSKEEKESDKVNIVERKGEFSAIPTNDEVVSENGFADSLKARESNLSETHADTITKQTTAFGTQVELKSNSIVYAKEVADDEVPIEPEKRRVEPFTWAALGCFVLGGILGLLSIVVSIPEITLTLTLACAVTFIIFSMVSIAHIRRNPGAYKARWLSWTFFGLSSALIGLTLYGMISSVLTRFF